MSRDCAGPTSVATLVKLRHWRLTKGQVLLFRQHVDDFATKLCKAGIETPAIRRFSLQSHNTRPIERFCKRRGSQRTLSSSGKVTIEHCPPQSAKLGQIWRPTETFCKRKRATRNDLPFERRCDDKGFLLTTIPFLNGIIFTFLLLPTC